MADAATNQAEAATEYGAVKAVDWDPIAAMAAAPPSYTQWGGVNVPAENSITFASDPDTIADICHGKAGPDDGAYCYSRDANPTVVHLNKMLAALEGTEAALCFASGMSAISSTLLQLCSRGDHIVASNSLYGGTHTLLTNMIPRVTDIQVTQVNPQDLAALDAAFVPGKTKVCYVETMSNPALSIADLPAIAEITHKHKAVLVVDNTFAPLIISPKRLGADMVIHSLSKFLNGSGDVLGGVVCGPKDFVESLMEMNSGAMILLGGTMAATVAEKIALRLPHAGLRVAAHSARALGLAQRLESRGVKVSYPGLPSHPGHELLGRLRHPSYGWGGLLCIDAGSTAAASALIRRLSSAGFGHSAVSLGHHDTLLTCPGASTSSGLTEEERATTGISSGLIRVAVGYTGSLEQRWEQLLQALVESGVVGAGN